MMCAFCSIVSVWKLSYIGSYALQVVYYIKLVFLVRKKPLKTNRTEINRAQLLRLIKLSSIKQFRSYVLTAKPISEGNTSPCFDSLYWPFCAWSHSILALSTRSQFTASRLTRIHAYVGSRKSVRCASVWERIQSVLYFTDHVDIEFAQNIIKAFCVLHNCVRLRDATDFKMARCLWTQCISV